MSFCPQCGTSNADDARFCEKCGTGIAGATPPAAPPVQASAPVTEQAKAVANTAAAAAKKIDPKLVVVGIVVLVLLAVGIVVTRPMDKRDYKDEAEDLAEEILGSESDIASDLYDMMYAYDDSDDDLDSGDVEELRETFQKESKKLKEAAKGIERLRPPSDYKDADKDLRAWAKWTAGDGLAAYDSIITQAEQDGMTYEDFEELWEDWYEEYQEAGEDSYEALEDAIDDLNIEPYGEEY